MRLTFLPNITPRGTIRLQVTPEVSSLDFANGLLFQGFNIPAISTRRVQTEIELESGQSFAIAGLLDNRVTEILSKIPGLGDIPLLREAVPVAFPQQEQHRAADCGDAGIGAPDTGGSAGARGEDAGAVPAEGAATSAADTGDGGDRPRSGEASERTHPGRGTDAKPEASPQATVAPGPAVPSPPASQPVTTPVPVSAPPTSAAGQR